MRLLELPVELQRLVLQRVPLRTLLRARQCSWSLHDMILEDARWLPIVAPPSLENQTLSLAEHASQLIALYGRYEHWLAKCEELIDNKEENGRQSNHHENHDGRCFGFMFSFSGKGPCEPPLRQFYEI